MAFVHQYSPSILAGILLALILAVYMVLALLAYRRRTRPPRALWLTAVFIVIMFGLAFLEVHFRATPGNVDLYLKDTMVAIGTMLVVSMVVTAPLMYVYGRSMPPMTEAEREAWLERSMRDVDVWARLSVATHGVTLMSAVCILAAFLVIVLIRALVR